MKYSTNVDKTIEMNYEESQNTVMALSYVLVRLQNDISLASENGSADTLARLLKDRSTLNDLLVALQA